MYYGRARRRFLLLKKRSPLLQPTLVNCQQTNYRRARRRFQSLKEKSPLPLQTLVNFQQGSSFAITIMANSRHINLKKTNVVKAGLRRPHDVICHDGRYVIADTCNNRITTVSCKDLKPLGYLYQGNCNFHPYGLVALPDSDNHFLITDDGGINQKGCVYDLNNGKLSPWAGNYPSFNSPIGIALCEKEVFVADWESNCIHVFNMAGKVDRLIEHRYMIKPWFLAFNSKNLLYVASLEYIHVFNTDGSLNDKFRINTADKVWHYRGIAIDAHDNIFITARSSSSRILITKETLSVLDFNHKPVTDFTGGWRTFLNLRGLCIDADTDKVVVVDAEWHELKLFSLH